MGISIGSLKQAFLFGAIMGSFSLFGSEATPDPKTVLLHMKLIQELKGRTQEVKQPDITGSVSIDDVFVPQCNSQTYAYFKDSNNLALARGVINNLSSKIKRDEIKTALPAIIKTVLNRECEYADKYYVLYHGESMRTKFLQQIIKKIESWRQLLSKKSAFIYLRTPTASLNEQTVKMFLERENPCEVQFFDHQFSIADQLLAVNISLFGNSYLEGESSFHYWIFGRSFTRISLEPIIGSLGVSKVYIERLNQIFEKNEKMKVKGLGGNLLQIFIPKNDIDKYAYPSIAGGYPLYKPVPIDGKSGQHTLCGFIPNNYSYQRGHFWIMSEIFERMLTNQKKLNAELARQYKSTDSIQARLLITPTINNPASGVKIYEYALANYDKEAQEELQNITNEFDKIIDDMFIDWIQQKQATLTGTLAEKLLKYIAAGEQFKVIKEESATKPQPSGNT